MDDRSLKAGKVQIICLKRQKLDKRRKKKKKTQGCAAVRVILIGRVKLQVMMGNRGSRKKVRHGANCMHVGSTIARFD